MYISVDTAILHAIRENYHKDIYIYNSYHMSTWFSIHAYQGNWTTMVVVAGLNILCSLLDPYD